MVVSIFGIRGVAASMDRYMSELAGAFPPDVEVRRITAEFQGGIRSAIWHRRLKYILDARAMQGDANIVVNASDAYLLFTLDPARTVVVCHNAEHANLHPPTCEPWAGTYRLRFRLNLWFARRARAIIAVSEHTRRDLLKYCPFLPANKVIAVPNGLSKFWQQIQDESELMQVRNRCGLLNKRVVLHVGSDSWYKNFSSLIHAFARLPDRDVVLMKVGEIGDANRNLIDRLAIADRVVHIRDAGDAELRQFYNVADMLVFPSLHEGFGWPPLEAMACGCPVIASRKGSLPEVCGDACLYIDDPLNIEGISAAIGRLLRDAELRAALIERGQKRAAAFNWQTTAVRILECFPPGVAHHKAHSGT